MDSSGARIALETDIITHASKTPLIFEADKAAAQIELVLKMLLQVNSLYTNKSRTLKECAILFKRFCMYADTIVM